MGPVLGTNKEHAMLRPGPTAGQRRLQPHEKVVVIAEEPTSGATLGYYGRIVRVHTSSMRLHPNGPSQWTYSVFVRSLQDSIDVVATSMFATGEVVNADLSTESDKCKPIIEIRFHSSVMQDITKVDGAYRLPKGEWRLFSFHKSDVMRPSYQLSVPIPDESSRVGIVEFLIPLRHNLDKKYIFQTLAEVHGIVQRQE